MSEDMTVERVQTMITRAPYHQWLGLKVIAVHDDGIELTATWREEWVVNPERRYTHGEVDLGHADQSIRNPNEQRRDFNTAHRERERKSRRRKSIYGRSTCRRVTGI